MVGSKGLAVIMESVTLQMEHVDASVMRLLASTQKKTARSVKMDILVIAANVAASMVRRASLTRVVVSACAEGIGLEPIAPCRVLGCLKEVYQVSVLDVENVFMGINTRKPPVCAILTTTPETAAFTAQ